MRVQRLSDLTHKVFIPPRFKRVYVDKEHGVPFLQGTHVVQFQPTDLKYLSWIIPRLEQWQIQAGWLLVTCSGSIGRSTICPRSWDGWAASQHILRIVPDEEKCPVGYLATFLASPLGQAQLTANVYGAVVDELTEDQAQDVLVPVPENADDWSLLASLDSSMREAVDLRSEATSLVNEAISKVYPSIERVAEADWFSLRNDYLDDDLRFDAGIFNPTYVHALELLSEIDTVRIGDIAEVFMPNRFKRVYVDSDHGLPFLQGRHVTHFQATGVKYLWKGYKNIDELIVEQDWLLVSRSGTVGRVALCPREWDGWAATEDIIRILPENELFPPGYLCSFLSSYLGRIQLTSRKHGAVVDHLTEEHVSDVLIPVPDASLIGNIDSIMHKGVSMKTRAVSAIEENVIQIMKRLEEWRVAKPLKDLPKNNIANCNTS